MSLVSVIFNGCVVIIVLLIFYIGMKIKTADNIIVRRYPTINYEEIYINPSRSDSDNEYLEDDDEEDWSDSEDE